MAPFQFNTDIKSRKQGMNYSTVEPHQLAIVYQQVVYRPP